MILLMGVVLAVMFVALALLVNAAIYTDNVATRGGDPAGEALEYQNGVVNSVSGLLAEENDGGTTADEVEPAIGNVSEHHRRYHLRRGAAAETSVDTVNEGLLIEQTDSGELENWNVDDAEGVRSFEITFEPGGDPGMPKLNLTTDDPFEIDYGESSRYVYISKNDTDHLVVAESVGDPICTADANAEEVIFDVTGGQFGGSSCDTDWPGGAVDGLSFSNGENALGTYGLTVKGTNMSPDSPPPDRTTIVYDVDLTFRITTPELRYERSVTVVPEGVDA
jgi:hypothetical protein